MKAIATTTCTSTDVPCHWEQKDKILTGIISCVLRGSNCKDPVQDLYSEWFLVLALVTFSEE